MKLTAPTQRPPQEPEGTGQPAAEQAPAQVEAPPVPAAPPPAPTAVTWPAWFAGADVLLAALALGLAFLISSFVARNSDLWVHLAAGKRLFAGEYRPGTDPFSYSTAGRAWVNHSLLFDAVAYLLYGGNGVVLVVVKALAFALTFGMLMAIRRRGFALWPWAAMTGIAILAAAPKGTPLMPMVGSVFMLAVTFYLLFGHEYRPGSWRFPIAIGIAFWIWAMVDAWFFVGPLTLLLALIGQAIQNWVNKRQAAPGQADPDPLDRLPNVSSLAKALAVGVVACTLTPHHFRIWELPIELIGSPDLNGDQRIYNSTMLTPLQKVYLDSTGLGKNINGLAYAILLIGGGVSIAVGLSLGRFRIVPLVLWLGFALLSFQSVAAIPLFAVAAVPIVAAQFNVLSGGLALGNWSQQRTRILLWGSAAGRVACLVLVTAACVLAWPGWMQPDSYHLALNRRVGWGVEADPGLVRAAQQIQRWRENGQIAPDSHGFIASAELANYCAWFAPLEKVFLNTDYAHHRPELAEFVALRSELGMAARGERLDLRAAGQRLDRLGAGYLAVGTSPSDSALARLLPTYVCLELSYDTAHWAPWFLDGRTAIAGRQSDLGQNPAFEPLRLDPVVRAFGPAAEMVPAAGAKPIPPPEGWEGEFLHGVSFSPPAADEALGWLAYLQHAQLAQQVNEEVCRQIAPLTPMFTAHQLAVRLLGRIPRPLTDVPAAAPLLSLRAARRAIASAPDHPDGYFAWFKAVSDPGLPISPSERLISQLTALRQCLMRYPPPEEYHSNLYRALASNVARELALLYWGVRNDVRTPLREPPGLPIELNCFQILWQSPLSDGVTGIGVENQQAFPFAWREGGQRPAQVLSGPNFRSIDLALETARTSLRYAEAEKNLDSALNADSDPKRYEKQIADDEKQINNINGMVKAISSDLESNSKRHEQDKARAGQMKLPAQVKSALRHHLVGEALRILTDRGTDLEKEYAGNKGEFVDILLIRVALELATGRLEDAAGDLEDVPKLVSGGVRTVTLPADQLRIYQMMKERQLELLVYQKLIFEGNYKAAGELLEQSLNEQALKDPPPTPEEAAFQAGLNPSARKVIEQLSADAISQLFQLGPTNPVAVLAREGLLTTVLNPYFRRQQALYQLHSRITDFFYQRGYLSLMEGDIPTAKQRFQQSSQPPVPEWGVPATNNNHARMYLRLIEEAERRARK